MDKIMLNDIAGYEQEKKELEEIIDAFHRYETYKNYGAYMPKGLILSGDPGVGKTLFARVLANEIDAPFYIIDGAEISGRGGVRRMKSVFRKASKTSPSVIFIDELNMFIGDYDYSPDDTQRNLSALLKLIDGITGSEGILVVGATSAKHKLDGAIMRSGRMDKHICLRAPNAASRVAIFRYYLNAIELDSSVINVKRIAEKMQGFTAADIKTLVNETAIECIHKDVPLSDDAFMLGIRKIKAQDINRESDIRNLRILSCHDIGHLLVSYVLRGTFDEPTVEFDAEATGNSSIVTLFDTDDCDDDDDDDYPTVKTTKDSLNTVLDKVAVLLGGLAAEEVLLGEKYLTSSGDIKSASRLIDRACDGGLFGFECFNPSIYYYSEISQKLLVRNESKIQEVLSVQYERAKSIIIDNIKIAKTLSEALIDNKYLSKSRVKQIISA